MTCLPLRHLSHLGLRSSHVVAVDSVLCPGRAGLSLDRWLLVDHILRSDVEANTRLLANSFSSRLTRATSVVVLGKRRTIQRVLLLLLFHVLVLFD